VQKKTNLCFLKFLLFEKLSIDMSLLRYYCKFHIFIMPYTTVGLPRKLAITDFYFHTGELYFTIVLKLEIISNKFQQLMKLKFFGWILMGRS